MLLIRNMLARSSDPRSYGITPCGKHTSSGAPPTGELRRSLVMRLEGLEITNRYVVLCVDSRASSFTNTLGNLIHVFGPSDKQRLLTYGTFARGGTYELTENVPTSIKGASFERSVIQFDEGRHVKNCPACFKGAFRNILPRLNSRTDLSM